MRPPIYTGLLQSDLDFAGFKPLNADLSDYDLGDGAGSGISDSGTTVLTVGQSYVDVTFSSEQPDAGWILVGSSIGNMVDATPLSIWPTTMTVKTTTGFRVQLNAIPDTANYILQWAISAGSLVLPTGPPVLTRYASNPIINYGGGGWKDSQLTSPIVFADPTDATKLIMIYTGNAPPVGSGISTIGIATALASNPYVWTECSANPFISSGASNWAISAVIMGTTVYLYVGNYDGTPGTDLHISTNLSAATAQAGTATFSRSPNVFSASGDETQAYYSSVIREDATHWYMAYAYRTAGAVLPGIRLATSSDGISWTSTGTELIHVGTAGSYDDTYIEGAILSKIGGVYVLTYNAYGAGHWTIALAKSASISSGWSKCSGNPVLSESGVAGTPDRYFVSTSYWANVGGIWYLYYQAANDSPGDYINAHWSMCMATLSTGNSPLDFF